MRILIFCYAAASVLLGAYLFRCGLRGFLKEMRGARQKRDDEETPGERPQAS